MCRHNHVHGACGRGKSKIPKKKHKWGVAFNDKQIDFLIKQAHTRSITVCALIREAALTQLGYIETME